MIANNEINMQFQLFRFRTVIFYLCAIFFANVVYADEVDKFIIDQMTERKIPGLQLSVVRHGEIIKTASYGIANLQDNVAVTDNTVFTLNSITKAFVGVAIVQLIEQGKIDLEASPLEYISDVPQEWGVVTIKQLLSHTSGLPEIMSNDARLISNEGEEAAWELVKTLPMQFKPNEQFRYNQTNYLLLGKIIEEVSGKHFEDFIRINQLESVGMPRTIEAGFSHTEKVIPSQARGYTYYQTGNLTTVNEAFPPFLRTAAGMSSKTSEMAKWVIALQSGKLIDKANLKILWEAAVLNNDEIGGFNNYLNGYALGWPVVQRDEHPAVAPAGGDRNLLIIYPQDDLSIIVLTNLMGAIPDNFIDEIASFYIPELSIEAGFGLSEELDELRKLLDVSGYNKVISIVQSPKKNKYIESDLNSWGYKLLNALKKQEALEIFKLNVFLFPESANTYDSLADAYSRVGRIEEARQYYSKVLEIDPKNQNAMFQLDRLK